MMTDIQQTIQEKYAKEYAEEHINLAEVSDLKLVIECTYADAWEDAMTFLKQYITQMFLPDEME